MTHDRLRVLVIDDFKRHRSLVTEILHSADEIEVVDVVSNGTAALSKCSEHKPAVIVLDVEAPQVAPTELIEEFQRLSPTPSVIVLGSDNDSGIRAIVRALQSGGFDFIIRPDHQDAANYNQADFSRDLLAKVRDCDPARLLNQKLRPIENYSNRRERAERKSKLDQFQPKLIAVGASTGGPAALTKLVQLLPADAQCPILVAQHVPGLLSGVLARHLDEICALRVCEAVGGQLIQPGRVYLAPGGQHMRVTRLSNGNFIQITDEAPEKACRPSADYLFRSLAEQFPNEVLGVVLTGGGDDGTEGARTIRQSGGFVVTQKTPSCLVDNMPRSVEEHRLSDKTCSLGELGDFLAKFSGGTTQPAVVTTVIDTISNPVADTL